MLCMRCVYGLRALIVLVCFKTTIGSFNEIWLTLLLDFERSGAWKVNAMFESQLWSLCVSNGGTIYICISGVYYMRCLTGLHARSVLVCCKTAIWSFNEIWRTLLLDFERSGNMNAMFESHLWSVCVRNGDNFYIRISGVLYRRCVYSLCARSVLVCLIGAIYSFNEILLTLLLDFERSGAGKMDVMV